MPLDVERLPVEKFPQPRPPVPWSAVKQLMCVQVEKGFSKRLLVTCSLIHSSHINADRLVVKANRSGARARVVFDAAVDSHRQDNEPSDLLLLPYTVDPYSVTAQLQGDNSLIIEAAVAPQSSNDKKLPS